MKSLYHLFFSIAESHISYYFVKGWQLCDGSNITTGPMTGLLTPNLNGEGRFLRGGVEFSEWEFQEQMLKDHKHSIEDPGKISLSSMVKL